MVYCPQADSVSFSRWGSYRTSQHQSKDFQYKASICIAGLYSRLSMENKLEKPFIKIKLNEKKYYCVASSDKNFVITEEFCKKILATNSWSSYSDFLKYKIESGPAR